MNSVAAQYLREVNKQLSCPNSLKRPFLRQLENEVQGFCADRADADGAQLSAAFGAPGEVAEEFLSELGPQAVDRCVRARRGMLGLTVGVILAAVVLAVFLGLQRHFLQQKLLDEEFVASVSYETELDKEAFWLPFWEELFGASDSKE